MKSECICFKNELFAFVPFSSKSLHKRDGLIYLHLQEVVELLTRGRKGLRSAELKVPQLVLCSGGGEKTKETVKRARTKVFSSHQNLQFVSRLRWINLFKTRLLINLKDASRVSLTAHWVTIRKVSGGAHSEATGSTLKQEGGVLEGNLLAPVINWGLGCCCTHAQTLTLMIRGLSGGGSPSVCTLPRYISSS